jgi:uncharacterized membrane protein YfcA
MGIGGGVVLIPAVSIFISMKQQAAQGMNLVYFIPTAAIALTTHIKNKSVNIKKSVPLIVFGIIGAFIGAKLAVSLQPILLKKVFGCFLLIMGFIELFKKS